MPTPEHTPTPSVLTRPPLPERHRIMLGNCDFWIGAATMKMPFDDHLWQLLRDDFMSLKEVLSVYGPKAEAPNAAS